MRAESPLESPNFARMEAARFSVQWMRSEKRMRRPVVASMKAGAFDGGLEELRPEKM